MPWYGLLLLLLISWDCLVGTSAFDADSLISLHFYSTLGYMRHYPSPQLYMPIYLQNAWLYATCLLRYERERVIWPSTRIQSTVYRSRTCCKFKSLCSEILTPGHYYWSCILWCCLAFLSQQPGIYSVKDANAAFKDDYQWGLDACAVKELDTTHWVCYYCYTLNGDGRVCSEDGWWSESTARSWTWFTKSKLLQARNLIAVLLKPLKQM